MVNNPGRAITQRQVSSIFRLSYERVATIEKAKNSFRATGIYPYNPDIFSDEETEPSVVTDHAEIPGDTLCRSTENNRCV